MDLQDISMETPDTGSTESKSGQFLQSNIFPGVALRINLDSVTDEVAEDLVRALRAWKDTTGDIPAINQVKPVDVLYSDTRAILTPAMDALVESIQDGLDQVRDRIADGDTEDTE